ncbi:TetR/AcrR family transcriptional regulator [Gemella sanguinis]|jgi:transcriptional regulator, tetR family|uniref:TetR/AcrR family transcriptional regulator n=1 Tax=Gemella sanguinis TaxID=84135 RepID=UPI00352CE467
MDKKKILKEAAYEVFSKKGYKATSISEITKHAKMAVGSFYNFYDSKETIFLDTYIEENNRIRQLMINNIDWEGDVVKLTEQLFGQSRSLISTNKILSEWYNPAISSELHNYYSSEKGKASNQFYKFLVENFTNRLQTEGYSQEKIEEILKIYTLFNYIDMNVTEKDIPNVSETTEKLAIYFVKGLFKGEQQKF